MQEKLSFIKKPYFMVLSLISLFLIIGCFSYAAFTTSIEKRGVLNIVTGNLYSSMKSASFNEQNQVTVEAGQTKYLYVAFENTNSIEAKMNVVYKGVGTSLSGVEVGYVENVADSSLTASSVVVSPYGSASNKKEVALYIKNTSTQSVTIQFESSVGLPNATLAIPSGWTAITNKISSTTESCFTFRDGSITGYSTSCTKNVVVPKTIGGVEVTSIGDRAFYASQLTNIIIPNSVTSIGDNAFFYNQLTSMTIPPSVVSIAYSAFISNQLTNVTIPDSVISIGAYAFGGNELTSVTLPTRITSIEESVFDGNQLASVTIPSSVTEIGNGAFSRNQLTSVTIPNSVTRIGVGAFQSNQLTSVTIPSSVINIETRAFNENQLPDSQAFIYARKNDGSVDQTKIVSYGGAKRENVMIPNNVKTIGNSAFQDNQITSVTIPNTVTSIEDYAFYNNQLKSIIIPEGITIIKGAAFWKNQLTSITLPETITSIEASAFRENQLTSVTIPSSVTNIGGYSFYDNQLTSVTIPSKVTSISDAAFSNNKLTSVKIQGKANKNAFATYPISSPFGWASGYSDANITWNAS